MSQQEWHSKATENCCSFVILVFRKKTFSYETVVGRGHAHVTWQLSKQQKKTTSSGETLMLMLLVSLQNADPFLPPLCGWMSPFWAQWPLWHLHSLLLPECTTCLLSLTLPNLLHTVPICLLLLLPPLRSATVVHSRPAASTTGPTNHSKPQGRTAMLSQHWPITLKGHVFPWEGRSLFGDLIDDWIYYFSIM